MPGSATKAASGEARRGKIGKLDLLFASVGLYSWAARRERACTQKIDVRKMPVQTAVTQSQSHVFGKDAGKTAACRNAARDSVTPDGGNRRFRDPLLLAGRGFGSVVLKVRQRQG